ncbi:MAG: type II toxin-antitoxin system HipA family toxin [Microcella sp.]
MADRELPVHLYGHQIGTLTDSADGGPILRWNPAGKWRLNSPVLSRHLRVGVEDSDATESFFGNLLPEGVHLDDLARETKTSTKDLVGMLAVVGADLAGALRIGEPHDARPPEPVTAGELRELLRRAPGYLVGGGGSALPGFQRKLTLTRENGSWVRGNGTIASTHILKPVNPDYRAAVDAEAYCLALSRHVGLTPFDAHVEDIDDLTVLVVERYDRTRTESGAIDRIHQEDFAQALGLAPGGDEKFQWRQPAANLAAIAAELDADATVFKPGTDKEQMLRYITVNVACGNTDAHAKNFSLIHDDTGRTRLAPLYDITPLALRFEASQQMAMTINDIWHIPDVTAADIAAEGAKWGIGQARAGEIVGDTLDRLIDATYAVTAHDSIERHVPGYVRGQAQNLAAGKPTRLNTTTPPMLMPRLGTPQPRVSRARRDGGQYDHRGRPESDVNLS